MSWFNFGGMNPTFKEFAEKHPNKTMIGMSWAFQWRIMLFILAIEIILGLLFVLITVVN